MKKYIPGSYSAHAEGMSTVKANITVDQDKITDLQLEMPAEIVKQQTLAVDAIKHDLKVALVEKNDQVGGLFRYSAGGYALANTKKIHD